MKTNVIRMFLALSAACVCGSVLQAQSNKISANVPFAFHAAGKVFPEGQYRLGEYGVTSVRTLESVSTGQTVFIAGAYRSKDPLQPGRLVFHCYSGNCFLAEIWPLTGQGAVVPMSQAEKEILNSERTREMSTRTVDIRVAD